MIINFSWWKWLLMGGAIGAMAVTLYAWQAGAEARGKLAILDKKLEDQIALTVAATEKADAAEAAARAADVELSRVEAEEEERRRLLTVRIAARDATIRQLRLDEARVRGLLEDLQADILVAEPSEVANSVQNFMNTEYAQFVDGSFMFRSDQLFVSNDPGARAILSGFTDAVSRRDLLGLVETERDEFSGKVDILNGMATSLNTQLEFTKVDLERWKSAFEAKDLEHLSVLDQIDTRDEMISC